MADIVDPFQIAIGDRPQSSVSSYNDEYNQYDFALGGVPFLSAVYEQYPLTNPMLRSSADFKREQIDQSSEPGEQSLTGWWLRSQSSFHWGAGLRYEDPSLDPTANLRFNDSEGVDPWTEGQVTLQHKMDLMTTTGVAGVQRVLSGVSAGVSYYFKVDNDKLYRGIPGGPETLVQTTSGPIIDACTSGQYVYLSTSVNVYQVPMTGAAGVIKWSWASGGWATIGWNKERLMLGLENSVYELSFSSSTLPTPLYTHPDTTWRWMDFDEGPVAIYAAGGNGSTSKIMKFELDLSGTLPVLHGGEVVADMPTGETVNCMYGYLGAFLTIGTSAGVRIATLAEQGSLEYGPLIKTPQPVLALWAKESHILAGYSSSFTDGGSGVMRIELQTLLPNGQYAYATDLQTHVAGNVTSCCLFGNTGRLMICVDDKAIYIENLTVLEPTGWFRTARIRYNMTWPKLFKQFSVDGDINGTLAVAAIDDKGNETTIATMDISTDLRDDFQINYPDSPQHFLSMRFTLNRNATDNTKGPTFRSYQLKALPAGPRPRLFTIPLLCFDKEKARDGSKMGYPGYCLNRLERVETMDSAGQVVLFEDLVNDRSWIVTIEQIQFKQVVPPARNREEWGGILTVQLRTIS